MKPTRILANEQNRLYDVSGDHPSYLYCVSVQRIYQAKTWRVLLKAIGSEIQWLATLQDGSELHLLAYKCDRFDDYRNGEILFRFINCNVKRRWYPRPQAMTPDEMDVVSCWAEIECDVIEEKYI